MALSWWTDGGELGLEEKQVQARPLDLALFPLVALGRGQEQSEWGRQPLLIPC